MILKLSALSALLLGGAFAASADTSNLRNANKIKRLPAGSEVVDNSYIVVLKSGSSRKSSLSSLDNVRLASNDVRQVYKASRSWTIINAFAANLTGNALQRVLDDSNVDYVEENGVIRLDDVKEPRQSAPAGVAKTQSATPGQGVDIYVLDTGVRITHNTFGGRARYGANFIEEEEDGDFNGHGTHCASTAAGEGFGPATSASIIAVKVLSGWGGGSFEGIISGVDWVTSQAQASGNPSVASMSLGGSASVAVDTAVRNSIASGVHYTIAAGNSNVNLVNTTPARVAEAVTVGALTEKGAKASFSNFGPGLDVWFLGQRVTAAWIDDDDAVNTISGTSMATPGVAGILAVAISNHGNSSPADLRDALVLAAPEDAIGVPSTSTKSRAVLF